MREAKNCLIHKTCKPCQGGVPPLTKKESEEFLNESAEKEVRHPDLKIGWGFCNIEIWTHKINGLTESDFILAVKIEAIYE